MYSIFFERALRNFIDLFWRGFINSSIISSNGNHFQASVVICNISDWYCSTRWVLCLKKLKLPHTNGAEILFHVYSQIQKLLCPCNWIIIGTSLKTFHSNFSFFNVVILIYFNSYFLLVCTIFYTNFFQ